jgi:hypothetical protein
VPPLHQVVRPRWTEGGQRLRLFVGNGAVEHSARILGGNALRMPANGGGDAQGPDCFLTFCPRVFSVILEGLSSNLRFLRARDVKGPLCNFYSPRVQWMNIWGLLGPVLVQKKF